jgi:hypothetical protein
MPLRGLRENARSSVFPDCRATLPGIRPDIFLYLEILKKSFRLSDKILISWWNIS